MLVGYDFLTVEWFFGKLFIPLAYIIGIPWNDCEKVGAVIAAKNIVNEFVAYKKLGELKKAQAISVSTKYSKRFISIELRNWKTSVWINSIKWIVSIPIFSHEALQLQHLLFVVSQIWALLVWWSEI